MIVYLMRHPETVANQTHQIYGTSHSEFTALGKLQVQILTELSLQLPVECIYASPLERVASWIRPIESKRNVIFDSRLEEMHFGIFEKLTMKEVEARYPDSFRRYLEDYETYTIPDGESFATFQQRVADFANTLKDSEYEKVLIVTHGMVIKELQERMLHLPTGDGFRMQVLPGSVVQINTKN